MMDDIDKPDPKDNFLNKYLANFESNNNQVENRDLNNPSELQNDKVSITDNTSQGEYLRQIVKDATNYYNDNLLEPLNEEGYSRKPLY